MATSRLNCIISLGHKQGVWATHLGRFYSNKTENVSENQGKPPTVAEQRAAKLKQIPTLEEYLKVLSDQKEVASRSALIFLSAGSSLEQIKTVCKRYGDCEILSKSHKLYVTYDSLESKKGLSHDLTGASDSSILYSSQEAKNKWLRERVVPIKASFSIASFKAIEHDDFTGHLNEVVKRMNVKNHEVLSHSILSNHVDEFFRPNFPDVCTVPHGSVVSNLGCVLSDLDLVVHLFGLQKLQNNMDSQSSRSLNQKALRGLKGYLKPHMKRFNLITGARVPILSFSNHVTGSDCDVSISLDLNTSVLTSHIFYSYAQCFDCVRPLLYTLKIWARRQGLTNAGIGGSGLSTFSLNHLMLYFLQHMKILPTLQDVHKPERLRKLQLEMSYDTGELYKEFFKFYEKFDFSNTVIDVRDGTLHKDSAYHEHRNFNYNLNIINSQSPDLNISNMTNKTSIKQFQKKTTETLSYFAHDAPKLAFFKHMNMDGIKGWSDQTDRPKQNPRKEREDIEIDNLVEHASKVSRTIV